MKVLVVEDSLLVTQILTHLIQLQDNSIEAVFCQTFQQAEECLKEDANIFYMALVDLNLPDAPNGEIVDLTQSYKLPTVVLTGTFDEERREMFLARGIVDYVVKESRYSYEYALHLAQRLLTNPAITILIAEDSKVYRQLLRTQLESYRYNVIEVEDGQAALECLRHRSDVQVLITDYHMPRMNGVELVKALRRELDKNDLVVIGLSSADSSGSLSAQFIKNGANDFLRKPFNYEELHCRVTHNLESIELLRRVREAAYKDVLTGLWNRRYLFEDGISLLAEAERLEQPLTLAMLDLDFFKKINDNYGHDGGDAVLRDFSKRMQHVLEDFLICRVGGEEFCLLAANMTVDQATERLESLRVNTEESPVSFNDEQIRVTISIGVSGFIDGKLDALIKRADEALYDAKESGRNRICSR